MATTVTGYYQATKQRLMVMWEPGPSPRLTSSSGTIQGGQNNNHGTGITYNSDAIRMPLPGSLYAFAFRIYTSGPSGNFTATVYKNGVSTGFSAQYGNNVGTTTQGTYPFARGDVLYVALTSASYSQSSGGCQIELWGWI